MGSAPSKNSTDPNVDEVIDIKKKDLNEAEKWAETVNDPMDAKPIKPGKKTAKVQPIDEKEITGSVQLSNGVIQDYINLEKSINRLERKNVLKKYENHTIQADNLKNTVEQLEAVLKELTKQTERERSDLRNIEQPSVKDFLKQKGQWNERYSQEKKEYEEAIKRQELVQQELKIARVNYENGVKIQEIYKQQTDTLNYLYDEQDKMLENIFGAEYASEKENVLEGEVDDIIDWQQRVSLAMFKWANGRVLLVHALTQLTFGINRWQDIEKIDKTNQRGRYFAAAEARNNFVAAAQNVQSCRMYLNKVDFPYATENDIKKLEETVAEAFQHIDDDKHCQKAVKIYKDTQQQIASLIQWFDKVINETIRKDLDQANNELIKKQKALREERLAMLRKLAKKELDIDIHIDYDDIDDDELEKELKLLEEQALKDIEKIKSNGVNGILDMGKDHDRTNVQSLNSLAPIPSKDALFGDVKQKLNEYDETRKQFERRNNLQREKQALALQEKLKNRQEMKMRGRSKGSANQKARRSASRK